MAIPFWQNRRKTATQSQEAKAYAKSEYSDGAEAKLVRPPEIFYLLSQTRGNAGTQSYGDPPPPLGGAVSPAAGDLCLRIVMIEKAKIVILLLQ